LLYQLGQELPRHVRLEQPIAVLREHRDSRMDYKSTTLRFASVSPWMYRCVVASDEWPVTA
jgi:hypothetical protein